jgi:hypothetical protein
MKPVSVSGGGALANSEQRIARLVAFRECPLWTKIVITFQPLLTTNYTWSSQWSIKKVYCENQVVGCETYESRYIIANSIFEIIEFLTA